MISFEPGNSRSLFERALGFGEAQVRRLVERHPGFYPMYTHEGRWKHELPAWTHWCDGFLPGMMWVFARRHGAASDEGRWWREQAVRYTRPLEPRKLDRNVHDLGFIFMSTYDRWRKLEPAAALDEVIREAGRTLALRFNAKGRYLRSFVAENSLFIDIMMNVGIIFASALETGDAKLLEVAIEHCLTSRRVLVRGDGSTAHEGLFDLETGEFLRQSTQQGYRGDSCWSRGLAWSLYGFGTAYNYVHAPEFLATAQASADFYLLHSGPDGVAPWDYDAPEESRAQVDTSAAAIAASGLLQLAVLCPDAAKGGFYRAAAHRILAALASGYLAESEPAWEGILKGGVYHIHKKLGVNESVMWGEYFFIEALDRALTEGEWLSN
jgi:unsaturated chondroitin disaccharide hydrolase